ncbi:uncharacterized protein N7473_000119 [Penicillium subrubescens]|uniref:uncharacterized protein n=1 Tax=Penicillium subrubescens TaxID=1316194 RepID=UPI002545A026|nr:uncharacterized protein N7473_000119 [Penicillium subrubescens]KAJ5910816.1 hypothetical protein N7473_000119 [Penicillium subrubescens]
MHLNYLAILVGFAGATLAAPAPDMPPGPEIMRRGDEDQNNNQNNNWGPGWGGGWGHPGWGGGWRGW